MIETKQCLIEFGTFIKESRNRREMTQAQVASGAGISREYYSNIENGRRNVDFILALKICETLHIDISDFIRSTQTR